MSEISLELKLLRGPSSPLTLMEEQLINTYLNDPSPEAWAGAADVAVQVISDQDDFAPLRLGPAVLKFAPQYRAHVTQRIEGSARVEYWNVIPDGNDVIATIKHIARTDRLPSIDLELDLARNDGNRLNSDERLKIQKLYYQPMTQYLYDAKDIVLIDEQEIDEHPVRLIDAIDAVAPVWLSRALVDRREGGRIVKAFNGAPPSEITRAALIRATH